MEQTQYDGIIREFREMNNKLNVLINLLKPLKNISEDIELSKVSLNKMIKQDKTTSVYTQQPLQQPLQQSRE
jgi:hypothetical protein